jgi:hypothetical protein
VCVCVREREEGRLGDRGEDDDRCLKWRIKHTLIVFKMGILVNCVMYGFFGAALRGYPPLNFKIIIDNCF